MNPNKTIEYNSLSWVKAQLDDVLSDAQSNLNDYIENKVDDDLENCIEHLQLIYGTLQMVEVYGASMLAEEMQYTTQALLDGKVESDDDAYDVLMRAMLQLPDYLEGIQAGKTDAPIALMPLINDLRAARNESLLTEGVLFSPDIENTELNSVDYNSGSIESGELQEEVKRLRTHYQLGLLDFIRNNKERAGLQRIKAVLNALEKVSSNSEVRHIWMIAGALAEGLNNEGIENSLSVKKLLGAIDRQFKQILDLGESEFKNQYSKELVTNILYYVGLSTVDCDSVTAIKNAYKLDELLPHESGEGDAIAIAGLNAELFETVSKGITEDLGHVKDVLELFMQSGEKETEQLVPVAEQLGKIGDTYGMLGMGAARQSIMEQRDVLGSIISGEVEIDEQTVLGIATELLGVETALKDFIDERSGIVDRSRSTENQVVPAAEYRQVVFSVVSEGLNNFSEAKEAVLLYISGTGDEEQLDIILNRLEEVRGVAMMLPLDRVESQIEKLQDFVRIALRDNNHQATAEEQDTVADVVTSIEYFLEALSEGRPGVEQGLATGDIAADKLLAITASYDDTVLASADGELIDADMSGSEQSVIEADAVVATSHEDDLDAITDQVDVTNNVTEFSELALDGEGSGGIAQSDAEDITLASVNDGSDEIILTAGADEQENCDTSEVINEVQYVILADDADEEIVEIFIEEAVEVLGELHENVPLWRHDPDNEEALSTIRRGFHTLKGSGRLLGAEMIGEFSWKFENMLNRFIEKKINVSESLFLALDEALAVLPQLIEQLKGNREPIDNIAQLMSVADAIADGRDASFESVEDSAVGENVEELSIEIGEIEALDADDLENTEELPLSDVSMEYSESHLSEDDAQGYDIPENDSSEVDIIEIDSSVDPVTDNDEEGIGEFSSSEIESASEPESGVEIPGADIIELYADGVDTVDTTEEADEIPTVEAETVEVANLDEVVTLDVSGMLDDDFSSELDEIEKSENNDFSESNDFIEIDSTAGEAPIIDVDAAESSNESIESTDSELAIESEEDMVVVSDGSLDLDPVLLKIYYEESIAHVETIRQQFAQAEIDDESITINKDLMRAFHTLYGSARTAEVNAIAELTGTAEKYIKAREDSGVEEIPDDVAQVLREIEQSVTLMLEKVVEGTIPSSDEPLHEKIDNIFQQEMQQHLQKPWQDNSMITTDDLSDDIEINDAEADGVDDADLPATDTTEIENQQTSVQVEMSYGDIDDELIDIFLEEADELLESCEQVIGEIKEEPNSTEHIHKLQRNMHTLKGGARMADLSPVGDLTHNLESLVVMVNDKKLYVDKAWFDLLQESLDVLTSMLAAVRKRESSITIGDLNDRIEMMMRGETQDKRSVERFDVDLSELESSADIEELEEIDITPLLEPKALEPEVLEQEGEVSESDESADAAFSNTGSDSIGALSSEQDSTDQSHSVGQQTEAENKTVNEAQEGFEERRENRKEDKPHWGERASDVNFKDSNEQVRVRSDLLNNLVDYAGEVNIYHARMGKQISDFGYNLSELTQTVDRLKEQLRKLEIETEIQIRSGYEKESDAFDDKFDPLEMDQYSTLHQITRSLSETAGDVDSIHDILSEITRDTETLLIQESRISTDLQEGLMRTRMVRFGGLSSRLRRIVRQISRELGKEVEVKINGESSEVDRTILDRIIAPLEHMLRNAVAHGIELPDERRAKAKHETGVITVSVDRQGADVVIDVQDDGAGIDVHKIREKAVKQGLMSVDTEVSDHDALQFILHSGFSTADEITQVSGRGVGMDVVDSEIKQLGGILEIDTVPGKGSKFRVRLPLTLAINQALLVSVADDVFAVPLASIEGVVRITGVELQSFYDSDHSFYEFNGVEYELKHLGALLTGQQSNYSKQLQLFPVLLVHVGDQHFALHVEDLIGRREIVVKPVGLQIGSVHGIAGATILADGRVVLILEMSALVVADSLFKSHVELQTDAPVEEVDVVKTIMVVDDSITIRKITERMLKRYGINVILAKDGVDATNLLQDTVPDMMLLDIEMPRMDGFEVASYVRNDERLKGIPIIMITSRTGSKHKEKAMEIGVDQYLGKPFQEEDLLNNINAILETSF